MNSYSLKKTYRRLLTESMVDKSTFLIKMIDYLEKNDLEKSSVLSIILGNVVKEIDLKSIIESGNKKARKKAEAAIHKKLALITGLDDTPFSFKDISPLYSSIIKYIESGKEISVSDAMLASDYYIKKMYSNADEEDKALIAKGKMSIAKIIEKTGYYKKVSEKVKDIRNIENNIIEVYEDDRVRIVYPTSSYAFNQFIDSNRYSVTWCTQNPSTWFSYTSKQLVMIAENKLDREIISLKVNYDGTVDYKGTCDYGNAPMTKGSVLRVISKKGDNIIFEKVNEDPEFENLSPNTGVTTDEFLKYIKSFIEFNEYSLVEELIEKCFQYDDPDVCAILVNSALEHASASNKKEKVLDTIVNIFPDLYFNNPDIDLFWEDCLNKTSSSVYFCKRVFELAQNKRSHVKYFMMIAKFLKEFDKYANVSSNFKDLFLLAIDKNNVLNFEKILNLCINKKSGAMELLPNASNFPEMLETKGVSSFVRQKNGNITRWSAISRTKPYQRYLTDLFVSHKEKTGDLLGDKSLAEVDILLINYHYSMYERKERFYNSDFSNFKKDFVTLTNDDFNIIQQKVYTDIDTTKLFDTGRKRDNNVLTKLLQEFIEAYKKGNDIMIDVKSEKTFEIFKYLLENAIIYESYESLLEIFDKLGRNINTVPDLIAEKFTNTNYESFYGLNKIESQESLETYINKSREGFDQSNNINSFAKFINDTISYLKDRDIMTVSSLTLEDKFAISIVNIPVLKNFLINKDSLSDLRNDYKFDPYIYFYLLKDSKHLNVDIETLDLFLNGLNASRNSLILVARYLAESMPSNVINSFFSDSNVIKGVIKNNLKHASLAMLIINKANQQDECLNKRSLSNIISNSNFAKVNENLRKLIYENFINISSSYGRNRLDNSERILVRNCLAAGVRKGQKHLSSDSELILNYCNNLDKYSKFQMRIVFPQKGMLTQNQEEDETIEESLVRQYIRLLLT